MAAADLIQVYTREGLPIRPLVIGQTTRVEVLSEIEGSTNVTITAATFELAKNAATQNYSIAGGTVTLTGNELYVDVTSSVLTSTLGANELETLNGVWNIWFSGYSFPVTFEEVYFTSRKSIPCPLRTYDLIEAYPLLGNANAHPIDPRTGARQTSWAPQIRLAWKEIWEWFSTLGREKAPWMICNCMALGAMVKWQTVIIISRMNINGMGTSQIWNIHMAEAIKELDKAKAATIAYYQSGGRNRLGEQPSMNRGPVQDPQLLTGTVSDEDFGKW